MKHGQTKAKVLAINSNYKSKSNPAKKIPNLAVLMTNIINLEFSLLGYSKRVWSNILRMFHLPASHNLNMIIKITHLTSNIMSIEVTLK